MKPLLVGESNPYGSDPSFALYPLPERASGWRLCKLVMGLERGAYLRAFDRVNLCTGKWSMGEARDKAQEIRDSRRKAPIVLCGAKVSEAFGMDFYPFTVSDTFDLHGMHVRRFVVLPHPSGLSRAWNEPGAFDRARAVLTEAGVLPVAR